jgi:hypothetical protein
MGFRMMASPRTVETPEQFLEGANRYLDMCEDEDRLPTVAGLALHLGFKSRQSIHDYVKKPAFEQYARQALLHMEDERSQRLLKSPAGIIFDLCNNHGWKQPGQMDGHAREGFTFLYAGPPPKRLESVEPDGEIESD